MSKSEDFLQYLVDHPEERIELYDKLWPEIEAQAKMHGFELKPNDLEKLVKEYCSSAAEIPRGSTWSR